MSTDRLQIARLSDVTPSSPTGHPASAEFVVFHPDGTVHRRERMHPYDARTLAEKDGLELSSPFLFQVAVAGARHRSLAP